MNLFRIILLIFGQVNLIWSFIDDTQESIDVTCLCQNDENCDSRTNTCRITNSDYACFESWSVDIGNHGIRLAAGYEKNK